ncbi:TPA: hypothetical protein ACNSTW_003876 [Acinetobacter baumannii]|uniref:hypothetical protein n=1 Tax=Acinetobacter baumannii TaxID=470 RepID=UPI00112DD5C3|nr:hypothetical protein [Acinetobacter baumannii]MCT9254723.1 hypothetical protein [Acinetobacter baumannii]MDC4699077.1 hypothetical protein [Acinetobacter baumannii]MDC5165830.1 hypothetical protein [Acinetobacter baumannii]MDC5316741.1 hypothetical protein [Acinetobacter baumannii]MDN8514588.1 hypothetical protein [Acinetobacter baumannii]
MFQYILLAMILNGCSNYDIQPKELAVAHVNEAYSQNIKISGVKVVDEYFEIDTNMLDDIELKIQPNNNTSGFNDFSIKGVPKYKGEYTTNILTGFYSSGSDELNKKYKLIIVG